jgi:hypothetical protein
MRLLVFFLALLFPMPLLAGACYTAEEFEAEQGLRLHTDMEVIMLTCKYDGYKRPLRDSYATFLKKYSKTIRKWENVIARSYAETGGSRNEVIDNFRTALANQKSHEAADLTPRQFCIKWANWMPAVAAWNQQQLLQYVHTPEPAVRPRKPPC